MASSSANNNIATLVFLDLETTGLPASHPHITEISLLAVERDSFISSSEPRVLNKLVLPINPGKAVGPFAERISGLSQEILNRFPRFDEDTALIIKLFLNRLPSPVCLLAHNGNRFDYCLLKSELSVLKNNDFDKLLCADTFLAFRALDSKGLLVDSQSNDAYNLNNRQDQAAQLVNVALNRACSDTNTLPAVSPHFTITKKAKRLSSYKLSTIYEYFCKKNIENHHSAEGDCISLMKPCHVNSFRILAWIDENAVLFETIPVMW